MRRVGMLTVAMVLVVAACTDDVNGTTTTQGIVPPGVIDDSPDVVDAPSGGSESGSPATPSSTVIMSDDGGLSIEIPDGAFSGADPGFAIRRLSADEFPEALRGASTTSGVAIYSLEPPGFQLDLPAIVRRYLDPENFSGLSRGQFPLTTLNYTLDGSIFHQVGDPTVWWDDNRFGASGTVSTLGTVVTLRESANFEVTATGLSHYGTETRIGLGLRDVLNDEPLGLAWSLSLADADENSEARIDGSSVWLRCVTEVPFFSVSMRWGGLLPQGDTGSVLTSTRALIGEEVNEEYSFTIDGNYRCSTKNLFAELSSSYSFAVDHPGGQVIIANEDFKSGLSGLRGSGRFVGLPQGTNLYMGLINDVDGNGWVDNDDVVFQPQHIAIDSSGNWEYTDALFGFGTYFVYSVDTNVWDSFGFTSKSATWGEIIDAVAADSSFSTSAGVFAMHMDNDWLLPVLVGPGEGVVAESNGEPVEFVHEPERILSRFSLRLEVIGF